MKVREEDIYNFIIGRTTILVNRILLRNFRKENLDITMEQWSLLDILWKKDGCTQHELGARTFREKASITRLLDKLEQQNIVIRVPDRSDRRVRFVYLTAKGKSIEETATRVVRETYKHAVAGIPEEQVLICKRVLNQVFENLSEEGDHWTACETA